MDFGALDAQIYGAIVTATASSRLIAVLVLVIAWINWNGLIWWLAGALISLLGDPEAVTELSRAGRARAAEFDWAKVAARYRDVYLEALS